MRKHVSIPLLPRVQAVESSTFLSTLPFKKKRGFQALVNKGNSRFFMCTKVFNVMQCLYSKCQKDLLNYMVSLIKKKFNLLSFRSLVSIPQLLQFSLSVVNEWKLFGITKSWGISLALRKACCSLAGCWAGFPNSALRVSESHTCWVQCRSRLQGRKGCQVCGVLPDCVVI